LLPATNASCFEERFQPVELRFQDTVLPLETSDLLSAAPDQHNGNDTRNTARYYGEPYQQKRRRDHGIPLSH